MDIRNCGVGDSLATVPQVRVRTLGLGDVVRVGIAGNTYCDATVRKINADGSVQVWRPYVACGDFAYTGGVILTIGIEEFSLWPDSAIQLVRKQGPLK